jgi:hypothetical protein
VKNVGKKIINLIYKLEKKILKIHWNVLKIDVGRVHDSYFDEKRKALVNAQRWNNLSKIGKASSRIKSDSSSL